ncbi:MAG: hypothetical protein WCX48_07795 [Bacteroidales bacterium]
MVARILFFLLFTTSPGGYEQVGDFFCRLDDKPSGSFLFRLRKVVNQPSAFIHIGYPEASTYKDWIDGLKDYIANHKISFPRDYKESMGIRVVYSLENHDLIAGADGADSGEGEWLFEKLFGPVRNGLFKWRKNPGAPILGNIVIERGSSGEKGSSVEGDILYVNDFGGNLWSIFLPR